MVSFQLLPTGGTSVPASGEPAPASRGRSAHRWLNAFILRRHRPCHAQPASAHHGDPVAHPQQLRQITAHQQHRLASPRHLINQLINHRHTGSPTFLRIAGPARLTIQFHRAGVRRVRPRQHLHQRALAGPILADQRQHLPRLHRQIHTGQRDGGSETLADTAHLETWPGSAHTPKHNHPTPSP